MTRMAILLSRLAARRPFPAAPRKSGGCSSGCANRASRRTSSSEAGFRHGIEKEHVDVAPAVLDMIVSHDGVTIEIRPRRPSGPEPRRGQDGLILQAEVQWLLAAQSSAIETIAGSFGPVAEKLTTDLLLV